MGTTAIPDRTGGMAYHVIHFGPDDCHRRMVLRCAGYEVDDCQSLVELRALLSAGSADAVVISDGNTVPPDEAIVVAKSHTTAPLILFCSNNQAYEDSSCDLVVLGLTSPAVWLLQVEALIARSRNRRRRTSTAEESGLESVLLPKSRSGD